MQVGMWHPSHLPTRKMRHNHMCGMRIGMRKIAAQSESLLPD